MQIVGRLNRFEHFSRTSGYIHAPRALALYPQLALYALTVSLSALRKGTKGSARLEFGTSKMHPFSENALGDVFAGDSNGP